MVTCLDPYTFCYTGLSCVWDKSNSLETCNGRKRKGQQPQAPAGWTLTDKKKKKKKYPTHTTNEAAFRKKKVIFKHQSLVIFPSKTTEQH